MAIIKFTNSKSNIKKIMEYITQPSKTEERLISGKDCMPESALSEMELVKLMYGKEIGRQYIHIVQSFDPKDELTHEKANTIGLLLAERFLGFQAVVATHKDRKHIHNHILLNSVNFETGLKFHQSKKAMQDIKDFSDKLCIDCGLSIIEKPTKGSDIGRNEYQVAVKGESWKITLILTIDEALKLSRNKEDFISNMNRFGFEVNWTDARKNITYTTPDGKKCRDNKLHDPKYLKEAMEYEFERFKEQSTLNNAKSTGSRGTNAATHPIGGFRGNNNSIEKSSETNGSDLQEPDYSQQRRSGETSKSSFSEGKNASKTNRDTKETVHFTDNDGINTNNSNNKRSLLADLERTKELTRLQPRKTKSTSKVRDIYE